MTNRRTPPGGTGGTSSKRAAEAEPLTVTQLTRKIDQVIKAGMTSAVHVKGELSAYKPNQTSGHVYFTLKDATSCVECLMWRSDAVRLKFTPKLGMEILVSGRVEVYLPMGKYQLYATSLTPIGQGALELAFRQMKEKLEREGLFAPDRKKPLPPYPSRIVLMTSQQGAALQDMLKVLRRYPWLRVAVYHVPVQGAAAAPAIAAALRHLDRCRGHTPSRYVILLARGGGSMEDLWCFNDEAVARAIAASRLPIVTGIGHEVDTSIADLVADYHAHTPTEAAQVVAQFWRQAPDVVRSASARLERGVRATVQSARQRLLHIERHEEFRLPLRRVQMYQQLMDDRERWLALVLGDRVRGLQRRMAELQSRLDGCHPRHQVRLRGERLAAMAARLERAAAELVPVRSQRLEAMSRHLLAIGPEQVLRRGYSITLRKRDGLIIRNAAQIQPGDRMITRFAEGEIEWTAGDGLLSS